jgi:hypothetical protein
MLRARGLYLGQNKHATEAVDGAPHVGGVWGGLRKHGIEVGVGILGLRSIFLL